MHFSGAPVFQREERLELRHGEVQLYPIANGLAA